MFIVLTTHNPVATMLQIVEKNKMLKMFKTTQYVKDGCGNITFTQEEVPLDHLIAIAKEEFPDPATAAGSLQIVVAAGDENRHPILVMTFHHRE